jgi:hypothetical protein
MAQDYPVLTIYQEARTQQEQFQMAEMERTYITHIFAVAV